MHNLVSSAKPATLQAPRISLKQRTHRPAPRNGSAIRRDSWHRSCCPDETVRCHLCTREHTEIDPVIAINDARSSRQIQFADFFAHELFGYREANCALASSALF
ncbi:MAG: hypothetical protein RLZZ232_2578 [Planctomycetota bacterium]|jgi:hypothetical protein